MTTLASGTSSTLPHTNAPSGLLDEIRAFWRQFFVAAFDPYRPERHYMRGPGPACAAKRAARTTLSQ
ncbi:MAG: hypothetical protein JWR89_1991 [Tardiphaga sp.]|uniref:hypothetical protein n=1 Tax=Tardiphaga sp. TaxID=1926292 RepID=UPI0026229C18|nr:hypothetical protein [Tardiphaga sp.]MDB5502089.1 hypothetical protein [Tardiphaga sp.]